MDRKKLLLGVPHARRYRLVVSWFYSNGDHAPELRGLAHVSGEQVVYFHPLWEISPAESVDNRRQAKNRATPENVVNVR
jgi:hypothetical protein